MKKYTHSLKAKVITFVIIMLLSVFAIINFIGICYVEHIGIYNGVNSYYDTTVCHGIACSLVDNVSKDYEEYLHNHVQDDKKYFIEKYSPDKSNLRFSIAKKETPDIIFVSIHLPRMDGLSLVTALRNEFCKLRITIVSEFSDFSYAQRGIELGISRYLIKPVRIPELVDALETMIKQLEC